MREVKEPPSLAAASRRISVLPIVLLIGGLLTAFGCSAKKTVKVNIPKEILQAKTASFDELLTLIHSYGKINTLSTDANGMDLTLTSSRKISLGELEKYRSLSGYMLLRRPNAIRFVLLIPITKSTLFDILSIGDRFSALYPREHEFFEGRNSAKELFGVDPATSKEFQVPPIRGSHIFEAIFPQSIALDVPDLRIGVREESDARASYYILSVLREGETLGKVHRIHTLREIYIERFGLTIARQKVFDEDGRVLSDITYSDLERKEGFSLPLRIHIERPQDGYILDLKFRKWNVDPDLQEEAFELHPGPEDRTIPLKERTVESGSK